MNETPTSEILNRAADLIEQRGWSTGGDAWGVSLNGEPPAPVPLCIEGGIIAALGIRAPLSDAVEAVSQCPAYQAVMEYVTPRMASLSCVQSDHLYRFNDSVARSASEVIEVLRACAVIEASRERETAEASHA